MSYTYCCNYLQFLFREPRSLTYRTTTVIPVQGRVFNQGTFGYEADGYSTNGPSDTTQVIINPQTIQILRRNSYHQQAVRQTPVAQSVDQVDAA